MTVDEFLEYYSDLLIMQYNNRPRAIATVQAYVEEVIADQISQTVSDGFNLETAVGVQLDELGSYRGVTRNIFGLDIGLTYFVMPRYADDVSAVLGFALYGDTADPSWYFIRYLDATDILNDSDFRIYIQFMADASGLDMGLEDIDNLLFKYFGNYVTLTDNEDMTITYHDDADDPNVLFKVLNFSGNLPRPAGVLVNVT